MPRRNKKKYPAKKPAQNQKTKQSTSLSLFDLYKQAQAIEKEINQSSPDHQQILDKLQKLNDQLNEYEEKILNTKNLKNDPSYSQEKERWKIIKNFSIYWMAEEATNFVQSLSLSSNPTDINSSKKHVNYLQYAFGLLEKYKGSKIPQEEIIKRKIGVLAGLDFLLVRIIRREKKTNNFYSTTMLENFSRMDTLIRTYPTIPCEVGINSYILHSQIDLAGKLYDRSLNALSVALELAQKQENLFRMNYIHALTADVYLAQANQIPDKRIACLTDASHLLLKCVKKIEKEKLYENNEKIASTYDLLLKDLRANCQFLLLSCLVPENKDSAVYRSLYITYESLLRRCLKFFELNKKITWPSLKDKATYEVVLKESNVKSKLIGAEEEIQKNISDNSKLSANKSYHAEEKASSVTHFKLLEGFKIPKKTSSKKKPSSNVGSQEISETTTVKEPGTETTPIKREPLSYHRVFAHLEQEKLLDFYRSHLENAKEAIDAFDKRGETVLHISCLKGWFEKSLLIIELGTEVNISNKNNEKPIHLLPYYYVEASSLKSSKNYIEGLNLLLRNGADIHAMDKYGDTSLHYAMKELLKLLAWRPGSTKRNNQDSDTGEDKELQKYQEFLIHMLQQGANLYFPNHKKETPLAILQKHLDKNPNDEIALKIKEELVQHSLLRLENGNWSFHLKLADKSVKNISLGTIDNSIDIEKVRDELLRNLNELSLYQRDMAVERLKVVIKPFIGKELEKTPVENKWNEIYIFLEQLVKVKSLQSYCYQWILEHDKKEITPEFKNRFVSFWKNPTSPIEVKKQLESFAIRHNLTK